MSRGTPGVGRVNEEADVYADWSALRIIGPAVAALLVLGLAGFVGYRVLQPEPELTSAPVDEADSAAAPDPVSLDPQQAAEAVLADFLARLQQGRFDGLTFAFSEPPAVQAEFDSITARLAPFAIVPTPGPVTLVDAANATAPLTIGWTLEDGVEFTTTGEVDLVLVGTQWQVDWEPAIIELTLDPGDSFVRERVVPQRAEILGRDGFALVGNRPSSG